MYGNLTNSDAHQNEYTEQIRSDINRLGLNQIIDDLFNECVADMADYDSTTLTYVFTEYEHEYEIDVSIVPSVPLFKSAYTFISECQRNGIQFSSSNEIVLSTAIVAKVLHASIPTAHPPVNQPNSQSANQPCESV